MRGDRVILHLDMDAFFAAVEQRDQPELRGRPVLVGSRRARGVVLTASYEARPYGCGSALPMAIALRRCPDAIVVPPRGRVYRQVSEQVFELLHEEVPVVQPLSIDEAFLDLTGTQRLLGAAEDVAARLKRRIRAETGLTCSVGVAPNKFLAKLASDLHKPDGLTVIPPDGVHATLDPLPVERLWGVGPATAKRLHGIGVRTIGDLRALPEAHVEQRLGPHGTHLQSLARGEDEREVTPDTRAKSIGQECTFETNLEAPREVLRVLAGHVFQVGRRLRRHGLLARAATVKIRFGDFETITRSTTLDAPTDVNDDLLGAARTLFGRWARNSYRPVRLIGFSATVASREGRQLELFADPSVERRRRLDRAMDAVQERFGSRAIRRGPGR